MYEDKRNGRILLRDGVSVLSSYGFAKNVIRGDKDKNSGVKVASDYDSEAYDYLNNTNLSTEVEDIQPEPESHVHSEEDLNLLIDEIQNSPRFPNQPTDGQLSRVEEELDYFERTNNIKFLLQCIDLLKKFRDNGVLWGVGRGSSCASYIAYLLMINDVNPLEFDIDFRELSKE